MSTNYEIAILQALRANCPKLTSIDEMELEAVGVVHPPLSNHRLFNDTFLICLARDMSFSTHLTFLHISGEVVQKGSLALTTLIHAVARHPVLIYFQLSWLTAYYEQNLQNEPLVHVVDALVQLLLVNTSLHHFTLIGANLQNENFVRLCEALSQNEMSVLSELVFRECRLSMTEAIFSCLRQLLDMQILTSLDLSDNDVSPLAYHQLTDLVCKPTYPRMLELNVQSEQFDDTALQNQLHTVFKQRRANLRHAFFSFPTASFGVFSFKMGDKCLEYYDGANIIRQLVFYSLFFNEFMPTKTKLPLGVWSYIFSFFQLSRMIQ